MSPARGVKDDRRIVCPARPWKCATVSAVTFARSKGHGLQKDVRAEVPHDKLEAGDDAGYQAGPRVGARDDTVICTREVDCAVSKGKSRNIEEHVCANAIECFNLLPVKLQIRSISAWDLSLEGDETSDATKLGEANQGNKPCRQQRQVRRRHCLFQYYYPPPPPPRTMKGGRGVSRGGGRNLKGLPAEPRNRMPLTLRAVTARNCAKLRCHPKKVYRCAAAV